MGIFDKIKNIMTIPEEDEIENENEVVEEEAAKKKVQPEVKRDTTPRVIGGRKGVQSTNGMQVVLVKPERFDEVTSIADHLNAKKTVLLNLEICDRELSRRIIDFLSGAAYANHGNIRKVAVSTFIIVPADVDVMGELVLDEFDESRLYF